jgi:hypothetical protein
MAKKGGKMSSPSSLSTPVMRESDHECMDSAVSGAHCLAARSSRTSKLSH